MSVTVSQITGNSIVCSIFYSSYDEIKIKKRITDPFRGESTGHRWILRIPLIMRKAFPYPDVIMFRFMYTVKPVYNDHLMGYFSAFWSSSRWPRAT